MRESAIMKAHYNPNKSDEEEEENDFENHDGCKNLLRVNY